MSEHPDYLTAGASGYPFNNDLGLVEWQRLAVEAWEAGDDDGRYRGTIEVFTGGGKSLIAIECMRLAALADPLVRVVVVVPTLALLRQWRTLILERTNVRPEDLGELHGERKDRLRDFKVVIAVLNTAAARLPELSTDFSTPVMLVIDESHRAGAPQFSRVLSSRAEYRLGLSATASREDVDDDGTPIEYDDHVLGIHLGRIVYRFDLRAARAIGWLPEFTVFHHAVHLIDSERRRYDEISRTVDDLADRLAQTGVDAGSVRSQVSRPGEAGELARAYIGAVSQRKDLLYRATERTRVTLLIVDRLMWRDEPPRVLLFHERIDQAVFLHSGLASAGLPIQVGLEHSRLPERQRREALAAFASGDAPILVSVKSLVEGIDVPDADVGVSVASSASVRQRIQALGRVLRRRFDGRIKVAQMHILYVANSVDESIYAKEDWGDLTGESANVYFDWAAGADEPLPLPGPPRTPRPTEDQFWESLGFHVGVEPTLWPCEWPRSEWRLDSRGTVTDLDGRLVRNPQEAVDCVRRIKPGGGRFRISHKHRLIVVPETVTGETTAWLVGRLQEPFRVSESEQAGVTPPANQDGRFMWPVDLAYTGPLDKKGGSFQIRQKLGGVIERRGPTGRVFALSEDDGDPRTENARRTLAAWRQSGQAGMKFYVNSAGDAYFVAGGIPHFLSTVPEGFAWPDDGGA